MSDNRLETKILLRYDTYSRLMNSNVILSPGEAAVAAFPDTDPANPPRAFGVKVGDGRRYFDELPWIQAIAADVYEWAKDPQKPVYQATEIQGLAEFIQQQGGGSGGGGSSSGSYRIIWDATTQKYILQQWDDATNDWSNTTSSIDLSGILNRLNTIERWANGARTGLGNIEAPLSSYVYDELIQYLDRLDVNDEPVEGQFVTAVLQNNGAILVQRAPINLSEINQGILGTERGGTGLNQVFEDEVLVGSIDGTITTKGFTTEIDTDRNVFATVGAIKDYVAVQTAGLTGAMHFIGETSVYINPDGSSRVNPQISGYNFNQARSGDVILANNAQEFVWTGTNWRLLGDEGSYAIKGSIVNADISEDANIAQSKIAELPETLENKVDKIEGKGLSSNDYTDSEKDKLEEIEEGAQANIIEHITLNDTEVMPDNEKTVNLHIPVLTEEQLAAIDSAQENVIEHIFVNNSELPVGKIGNQNKSVNIEFVPYSQEEKDKLSSIENNAQVNTVESIVINGTTYEPNNEKEISIELDENALQLTILDGARYPNGNNTYTTIDKDPTNKLLELSKVAATGNIADLVQTEGARIILNGGEQDPQIINYKASLMMRSGTQAYWELAENANFTPYEGELIVYSPDANHNYSRLKIGDGTSNVAHLEFIDAGTVQGQAFGIIKIANFAARPQPGSPDKLYVDLSTNSIYHYNGASGYTQISNFSYTTTTSSVAHVNSWSAGTMTQATVENNILKITNGSAPNLSYYNVNAVTGITKVANTNQ